MTKQVLVGDAGGTNVRFALASLGTDGIIIEACEHLPNDAFDSFESALSAYLKKTGHRPAQALFALAGPIQDNVVQMTNRDWTVSVARLKDQFGFHTAQLVNDYAAMARAIPELPAHAFETVIDGEGQSAAPIFVGGPGTGFGMATLIPGMNGDWHVLTGEGGHVSFSAQTEREYALLKILNRKHEYVSLEMVTSGMGLAPVHQALCELDGAAYEPMEPYEVLEAADNGDPICLDICRIRARTVMSAAGSFALANGAKGGAILTGGVSQRLSKYLKEPESLSRFLNRGPRSDYMSNIPVKLLRKELAPLIGAAALYFK